MELEIIISVRESLKSLFYKSVDENKSQNLDVAYPWVSFGSM